MRNNYLKFTSTLSHLFANKLGLFWWSGELQEKNSSKDNTIHILLKSLQPVQPNLFKILFLAVKKYFSFIARYFIFKFKKKPKLKSNLFFSYYGDHFSCLYELEDSSVLIIPQKGDWKKVYKDKDVISIYQYIKPVHFFQVPIEYFCFQLKYLKCYFNLKFCIKELGRSILQRDDAWEVFKDQIRKSFQGQLLIENLFFQKIFHGINLENPEKVIYVYEGLGWEKLLCEEFEQAKKIGVLCSLPADKMTQFWYEKDEVKLMPKPDVLFVIGRNSFYRFKDIYGSRVFLFGSTRHQYLKNVKKSKGTKTLVLLGFNDDQSKALLEWADKNLNSDYIVKPHPKSLLKGKNFVFDALEDCLDQAKVVIISSDTMTSFEAMAKGLTVIIPELDNFADINPLPKKYRSNEIPIRKVIDQFFTFTPTEEMIKIIEEI